MFSLLRSARSLSATSIATATRARQGPPTAAAAATSSLLPLAAHERGGQSQSPSQSSSSHRRTFSKKIVDIRRSEQRAVWSSYLSGSLSPDELFAEIDLNRSRTITVEEINYFLESVAKKGVDEKKFDLLQRLGSDHELDKGEFRRWLAVATDVKNDGEGFVIRQEDEDSSSSSSSSDSDGDSESSSSTSNSSQPKTPKKVVDARRGIQVMVWDTFLSTGNGAGDLFKMIDLNRSTSISVGEIHYFVRSIGARGVSQGKLNELMAKGEDHELDEEEFYEWLGDATGVELTEEGECDRGIVSGRGDAEGCTPGQW